MNDPCRHGCTQGGDSPCVMVVFGASGDLTRRKLLPALYDLERRDLLPANLSILGFSRSQKTDESWQEEAKESVQERLGGTVLDSRTWTLFARRLHYASGQYDDPSALSALHARAGALCGCGSTRHCLFYMALPPSVTETVLVRLKDSPFMTDGGSGSPQRLLMEKPFGVDVASARTLNELTSQVFDESQVYRIDHYLAKDTVRNLMVFRFANAIFEPIWNRNYVDHVQITAAEAIGIEDRGGYYEGVGVVRDMLQNHVLQVLALATMEPPLAGDEESIRDKKAEIFRSVRPLTRRDFVFGQFEGYRKAKGVSSRSVTPTFAAARLHIDNWRWQGVPFYIRSGKALDRKLTEVVIRFRSVPLCILGTQDACANVQPNVLYLRIQPDEGIRLCFTAQALGPSDDVGQTHLDFRYADFGEITPESYARVIIDALRGKPGLFWRSDGVEAAWGVVEPMLEAQAGVDPGSYPNYAAGSWGPADADALLRQDGRFWLLQDG